MYAAVRLTPLFHTLQPPYLLQGVTAPREGEKSLKKVNKFLANVKKSVLYIKSFDIWFDKDLEKLESTIFWRKIEKKIKPCQAVCRNPF